MYEPKDAIHGRNGITAKMNEVIIDGPSTGKGNDYESIVLGSASKRRSLKKKIAKRYSDFVMENIKNTFIVCDGSINHKLKKGGFGGVAVIKHSSQIISFHEKMDTCDPTMAELGGIYEALRLMGANIIPKEETVIILSDSKAAINFITADCKPNKRYSEMTQSIHDALHLLRGRGTDVEFCWIPGHSGNQWSSKADDLAKKASMSWEY